MKNNLQSKDLMTNDIGDRYLIFVKAIKNFVNQWTCKTLEDAELSIKLFKKETKLKRSSAIIKDKINNKIIKEIIL